MRHLVLRGLVLRLTRRKFGIASAVVGAVACTGRKRGTLSAVEPGRLDTFLTRCTRLGFAGVVLVRKGDSIAFRNAYGLADRDHAIGNHVDTQFRIGSLHKQFVAAAILRLEMDGHLRTTDRISRYLGALPEPRDRTTIHHLLTHTSGLIPAGTSFNSVDQEDFVRRVKGLPLESLPGERFRYCNGCYGLLHAIVERVSGEPSDEFIKEHIFRRANMLHTSYDLRLSQQRYGFARGYEVQSLRAQVLTSRWARYMLVPAAFGASVTLTPGIAQPRGWEILTGDVWSTVEDLNRWDRALHNETILSGPQQDRLSAPQVRIPGSDLGYGYGWWISDSPFGRLAYHDGHYAGFESALLRYLDFDATIIVLANTRLMTEPRTWISAIRRETEQVFRGGTAPC